jgi:hypothetical protein
MIRHRKIERRLIKPKHFLLENLSINNKVKIIPIAAVKLIMPVRTPSVVPL